MTAQDSVPLALEPSARLRELGKVALLLLATGIALVPIFAVESLPLHDYPSHLARMYVLLQDGSNAALDRFYEVRWALMPNLAMDLLVPPLARLIGSVELAGKLFVAATMVLLATGSAFLHAALHRRVSTWPLLGVVLLYNGILWFGFLNFLFALGLFLWCLGAFVRTGNWPLLPRAALYTLLCVALFVAHLFGVCLFLVGVAGFSLGRLWERELNFGGLVREGLLVLPGALLCAYLFLFVTPTSDVATETSWSDLRRPWHYIAKFESLLYMVDLHDPLVKAALLLVASIVMLGLIGDWIRFDRRMIPVLVLLGLCFAAVPTMVSSSWFAYHRFPVILSFVGVASLDWTARAPRRALMAILVAFVALRAQAVTAQWQGFDRDFAPIRAALRELPKGTRLDAAFAVPPPPAPDPPAFLHLPSYVVLDADGFYPGVFSFPGQQPLTLTPDYADLGGHIGSRSIFQRFPLDHGLLAFEGLDPFAPALLARFDVLLTYRDDLLRPLPAGLVLLRKSGPWKLWRLPAQP
jgi:hypothetical protein